MRQLKISNKITKRESISLDKYLNDIGRIDLLGPDEEIKLAKKIKDGDTQALERLTSANLRFVVSVAKQYQNQGLSLSDLINEGNVGLLKAARRYDETKGFKFISYAVWWIRQSILQAIVEYSRIVRLPVNKVTIYNKVVKAQQAFIQEFEREPSIEELGELLELDTGVIMDALNTSANYIEFDAPVSNDDGDASYLDLFVRDNEEQPDDNVMAESMLKDICDSLSFLSPREKEVLRAYFGLDGNQPMHLDEIGDLFGLTRERVRQIKERAIRRLRKLVSRHPSRYLDDSK